MTMREQRFADVWVSVTIERTKKTLRHWNAHTRNTITPECYCTGIELANVLWFGLASVTLDRCIKCCLRMGRDLRADGTQRLIIKRFAFGNRACGVKGCSSERTARHLISERIQSGARNVFPLCDADRHVKS